MATASVKILNFDGDLDTASRKHEAVHDTLTNLNYQVERMGLKTNDT